MKLQIFKLFIWVLCMLFLVNCSKITNMTSKKMFVERLDSYKRSILWSDFETASIFIKPQPQKKQSFNKDYNHIKVTDYQVKNIKIIGDLEIINQEVEIRYYRLSNMVERSITDIQTWEWEPEAKLWYLVSGLPNFP
jgi:hypothetical protein